MVIKKKILIYDTTKGYYRFIKSIFEKEFEIINFFDLDNLLFNHFEAVIFIVNDSAELLDLISIYKKTTILFLGSRLIEIENKIKGIEGAIYLDLQQKRAEMIDFITYNFKILGMSEKVIA